VAHSITMYYNPSQALVHILTSEVYEDGSHKVVNSLIASVDAEFNLSRATYNYGRLQGIANVRSYTVSELL